jgi:hypothetical protein
VLVVNSQLPLLCCKSCCRIVSLALRLCSIPLDLKLSLDIPHLFLKPLRLLESSVLLAVLPTCRVRKELHVGHTMVVDRLDLISLEPLQTLAVLPKA